MGKELRQASYVIMNLVLSEDKLTPRCSFKGKCQISMKEKKGGGWK